MTCRKTTKALIHKVSYYPDLFSEIQDIAVGLKFNKDKNEIYNCLLGPPSRGKCCKMSFPRHNRMARVGFEPRPCQSQSRPSNDSTTLLKTTFFY